MMSDTIEVLGWTLLHFVWQGAIAGLLAAMILAALRRRSANARYLAAVAALGLMLLLPLVTIAWIEQSPPADDVSPIFNTISTIEIPRTREDGTLALDEPPIKVERIGIDFENPPPADAVPLIPVSDTGRTILEDLAEQRSAFRVESFLKPFIPWAVAAWLVGVGVLSLRLLASWLSVQRLRRRSTQPASENWQALLRRLAERLRVARPVQLVESALVEVPAVIGWLIPIILLPASAMTGLTAEQLEALLAHELAHVRRHDYLINLLQTVVETLLFYHPAVWWISHRIRVEREHCCDDLAVEVCGDGLTYAKALVALEELRAPKLGLAMSSRGGSLLARVARLLGQAEQQRRPTGWFAGLLSLVLLTTVGALGAGLLTPPEKPTEGLPNDTQPAATKLTDTNEETSGPSQRRGQETRTERNVVATVNGEQIFEDEILYRYADALNRLRETVSPGEFRKQCDQLIGRDTRKHIEQKLLVQETKRTLSTAEQEKLNKFLEADFAKQIEEMKAEVGASDIKELEKFFQSKGTTLALVKSQYLDKRYAHHFLVKSEQSQPAQKTEDVIQRLFEKAEIKTTYPLQVRKPLTTGVMPFDPLTGIKREPPGPTTKPTEDLPNETRTTTKSNDAKEETSGPTQQRGQETRGEHAVGSKDQSKTQTDNNEPAKNKFVTHPIAVSGRALNAAGEPIPGAKIYLASVSVDYKRLAETTADADGRYVFRDVPLPIHTAQPPAQDSGGFEVFGQADGYGFAWRPVKWYYPKPQPEFIKYHNDEKDDLPNRFHADEPIALDLKFPKPASLAGRIVDEQGKPVAAVKLAMRICEPLDEKNFPEGKLGRGDLSALNQPEDVPAEIKIRRTDSDGRFEFTGLPPDCLFRFDVVHADYARKSLFAATTDKSLPKFGGHTVQTKDIALTFVAVREVPVSVIFADNEQPAPKVYVGAAGRDGADSAHQTTDERGLATLRLPIGEYRVNLLPQKGTPYLETNPIKKLIVGEQPAAEPVTLRLKPGCTLDVTIVDAETGKGIPDIDLWMSDSLATPDDARRAEVTFRSWKSPTAFVERLKSDKDGNLRLLVEPGRHRFGTGFKAIPIDYEQDLLGQVIDCPASKTVEVTFQIKPRQRVNRNGENNDDAKGDLRSNETAGSGDPRRAQGGFVGRVRFKTEKPLPDLEKLVVPAGKVLDESLVFSKDGGLANVFVYLRKPTFKIEPPTEVELAKPFVLIAESGKFWPHASMVRVGRPVLFENGAVEPMNFRTEPLRNDPFNVLVKMQDRFKAPAFERSENIPISVKSNIKPWMLAHLLPLDHPFAAVTDDDGRFAINGLPPGEHEFRVWHERVGYLEKSLKITIRRSGKSECELEYRPEELKLTEADVLAWGNRLIDAKWIPRAMVPRLAVPQPAVPKKEDDAILTIPAGTARLLETEHRILSVSGFDSGILTITAVSPQRIQCRGGSQGRTTFIVTDETGQKFQVAVEITSDNPQEGDSTLSAPLKLKAAKPAAGRTNSDEDQSQNNKPNGDLQSNNAGRSGDPSQAQPKSPATKADVDRARRRAVQQKAESEVEIRFAKATAEVAKGEWEKLLESNRKVPGSVPESEVLKVESHYKAAEAQIELAEAERAAAIAQLEDKNLDEPSSKTLEARLRAAKATREFAKASANVAKLDWEKRMEANLMVANSVPSAEVERARLVWVVACLRGEQADSDIAMLQALQAGKKFDDRTPDLLDLRYRLARAEAELARAEYGRILESNRKSPGAVGETEVEHARLKVEATRLKSEKAKIELDQARGNLQDGAKTENSPNPTPRSDTTNSAIERAVAFLKSRQTESSLWPDPIDVAYQGGVSSLCVLALLQSGVKPDEAVIQMALASLRKIEPNKTYTVALQTMAFCASSPKEDAELIRRNVAWIESAQVADGTMRGAWSYGMPPGGRGDGSCSRFAVLGLHAAKKAGFEVQAETWRRVSDYYLTTQTANGGWSYSSQGPPSLSMTLAGMASLATANRYLPQDEQTRIHDAAIRKPVEFLETMNPGLLHPSFAFYTFHCLERAGHVSGIKEFGKLDWQADVTKRLLGLQQPNGSWKGSTATESDLIATSFALLSLTGQAEPPLAERR